MVSASSIRFQLLLSTAVAASLALPAGAAAQNLPVNPSAGSVTTSGDGHTMTVGLTAPRTAINWESFDVGQGYTVDFDGPNTVQAVLNRVVGDPSTGIISQSDINGGLTSDPWIEVFLINPAGIIFGNGASVDVGSLVASTLDVDDDDFLAGGVLDTLEPTDPNLYYFFGDSLDVVTTGVTVQDGAQVDTSSGPLTLLGAFVDVQAGGSITAATGVGLVAGNQIRVPADPGSRISFRIYRPTPRDDAITIGGSVSGQDVTAFMETSDSAENALLSITDSGSITATRSTGGDIVLNIAARTESDEVAESPGGIRNDGNLSATGDVVLAGAISGGVRYRPRFVENNGKITAGGDVLARAHSDITNAGTITAGADVTLSGLAFASDSAAASPVHITNSGTINAGNDVTLVGQVQVTGGTSGSGSTIFLAALAPALASSPDVQVTNSGTINAGGDVTLSGSIDISGISTDTATLSPSVRVINDGPITAGGDVELSGWIDISGIAASHIDVDADVNVANSSSIDADGDVFLQGMVDLSEFTSSENIATDIAATVNVDITNSGSIDAGGAAWLSGAISASAFSATTIGMAANLNITNSGDIAAGSDAWLSGVIQVDNFDASHIDVGADLQITNSGTIDASGSAAWVSGFVGMSSFAGLSAGSSVAADIKASPTLQITNSGTIAADDVAWIRGDVDLSDFTATSVGVTPDFEIANGGTVRAGSAAWISAFMSLSSFDAAKINTDPNLQITNSGTVSATAASGSAWLSGQIDLEGFSAETIQAAPALRVTNSGTLSSGGDASIFAVVDISNFSASSVDLLVDVGIANNGAITAGGDVTLSALFPFANVFASDFALASNVHVTNAGTISAQGDAHLFASFGDVTNSGKITADNVFVSTATTGEGGELLPIINIINSGTITARGNAQLIASNNITNSGVIDVGGVALLDAGNDIDNTGSVSAVGDAILRAGSDILDSSGTFAGSISGADVALSAGGSITAGTVTARDDIAIRAPGTVTTGTLISGATIGANGPVDVDGAADDLLPGVDLTGHDVDVDGSAIAVNVIRANGTGSDIRLRKPVTSSRDDLDFFAGGNITIDGAASAIDVAMDAGGNITVDGDVSARDDLALRAGGTLDVGILASGVTVGGQGPVDQDGSADALLGQTLTGHDLFVQAAEVNLPQVTANGTDSDLTVIATTGDLNIDNGTAGGTITLTKEGTTGILTAATLTAGTGVKLRSATDIEAGTVKTTAGDLDFGAAGDVTVDSSLEATDVAISAGGDINTGDISARDDIALRAGGTLDVGLLTSGVTVGGTGPLDSAGAADALLGQTLTGHDLFVQAAEVNLPTVTANGADSDLTVIATAGPLTIANGTAGGSITLTKQGAGGILSGGMLSAGTGVKLRSSTDIVVATVATASGDLDFAADGDVTAGGSLSGTDVAIAAGGTITTGDISARDDIALRAGDTLHTGTLASGVTVGGQGPVDSSGAADALLGAPLDGHDLSVQGGHVDLASATANGSGSDLIVRATSGDLAIASGAAGGSITLVKQGASGTLTAGTLAAGTGASLTSSTGISASNVQSTSGDIDFDAAQGVSVGTVLAQAGDVNILADDLDILGGITGSDVSITNREGGNLVTALGDADPTDAFALTEAELGRIHSGTLTIDSLGQDLLVGNVAFADGAGSTRINLLGTGRVDIVGEVSGAGTGRTLQIGGTRDAADPNDPATLASIIRIAPMSSGGGRIIFAGGSLDLRGAKIGVGLDDGFLTPLGLTAGGSPASTAVVQDDWIGNFRSSLYGIPGGYADPVVISAGTITVTYADYALFQNTAGRGPGSGVNADVLNIVSSGDETNGFELFGTIDQVGGIGAAFLVQPQFVSLPNSRINGCLILTGGGCGNLPGGGTVTTGVITGNPTGDANNTDPSLSGGGAAGDDFSQQDLVSSGDDEAFSFDSLVGTNNEGLLGIMGVDDANDQPCAPDDKRENCRVKERANEQ
jgi:filamentous hemagglutinin family protein